MEQPIDVKVLESELQPWKDKIIKVVEKYDFTGFTVQKMNGEYKLSIFKLFIDSQEVKNS